MRKIILLCLALLFLCAPVYASEMDDAKQIVSDLKDISYRYEAGLSYNKYSELYSDVYVKVRRFEDTYPGSELVKSLKDAVEPFGDARKLWRLILTFDDKAGKMIATEKYRPELEKKYPEMNAQVEKIGVRWDGDSALSWLFRYGNKQTKDIESKLTAE